MKAIPHSFVMYHHDTHTHTRARTHTHTYTHLQAVSMLQMTHVHMPVQKQGPYTPALKDKVKDISSVIHPKT